MEKFVSEVHKYVCTYLERERDTDTVTIYMYTVNPASKIYLNHKRVKDEFSMLKSPNDERYYSESNINCVVFPNSLAWS